VILVRRSGVYYHVFACERDIVTDRGSTRLADFEAYLSFIERSLENLQFVVWYQSYRQRFFALPDATRALSPGKAETEFSFNDAPNQSTHGKRMFKFDSFGQSTQTSGSHTDMSSHDDPLRSLITPLGSALTSREARQPFRDECERIVATFFSPNALKELSLSSDVRDAVLRDLEQNTHPDVFLPAYEAIFYDLQTCSLPRFLTAVSAVTCRPNQIGYITAGTMCCVVSIVVFVVTMMFAPWDDFRARALRLAAVFPFATGTSTIYAGWHGYCMNIHGRRKGIQLRPWELEVAGKVTDEWWGNFSSPLIVPTHDLDEVEEKMLDAENGNAVAGPSHTTGQGQEGAVLPANLARIAARDAQQRREAMLVDVSAIAPWAENGDIVGQGSASTPSRSAGNGRTASDPVRVTLTHHNTKSDDRDVSSINKDTLDYDAAISMSTAPSRLDFGQSNSTLSRRTRSRSRDTRSSLPSIPVYGPEKVVLDPRIVAVHNQVFKKVCLFTLGAYIVSLPRTISAP
jgi:hypothetical protein